MQRHPGHRLQRGILADGAQHASTIQVTSGACPPDAKLVDVDVRVRGVHNRVGDLELALVHPSGRRVLLLHRVGLGAASAPCESDDFDLTFSDEGTGGPECELTIPALSGTVTPVNPLSALDGLERHGRWTLEVRDLEAGGLGVFDGWSLDLACALPQVSVTTTARDTAEGGGEPAVISFTREGPTDSALSVGYALSGSAAPGADYEVLPGRLVIPAGASQAALELRALADGLREPLETVVVTLAGGEFSAGSTTAAAVNLLDVTCGDGLQTGPETCDDGNVADGDACSAVCALEPQGCGCTSAEAGVLGLLGLVGLLRRRRR